MRTRLSVLPLLCVFAVQCFGIPLEAPIAPPPGLTAGDLAWADGRTYVKGLLPDMDGNRISSVQLDFVSVDGSRRTIVAKQKVEFPSNEASRWSGVSGELLILLEAQSGKTQIFMGIATLERSTQVRSLEDLGDATLPAVTFQFKGRTGSAAGDLRFTVPVGESELFQFVDGDGDYYGSLVVVAEGEVGAVVERDVRSAKIQAVSEPHSLTLRATGNVYVLAKERSTHQELYRGTLGKDDKVALQTKEEVDLLFTAGEHLRIEWDGKELKPSTSGTAKITLK